MSLALEPDCDFKSDSWKHSCSSIQPLKDVRGIKFHDLQSLTFPGSLLFGLQYVYNRVNPWGTFRNFNRRIILSLLEVIYPALHPVDPLSA